MTESASPGGGSSGPAGIPWLPYLSDLMGVYLGVLGQQAMRISGVYQRMASGDYNMDKWANDVATLCTGWIDDAVELSASYGRPAAADSVPTVVFVVDHAAQAASPKSVYLRARVKETDELASTQLVRMGAPGRIEARHVVAELSPRLHQLSVRLADLTGVEAGYYSGWVYVSGAGNAKIPLAAVQVVKLEPPASSGPR